MNEILKIIARCKNEKRMFSDDEVKKICFIILKIIRCPNVKSIDFEPYKKEDKKAAAESFYNRIIVYRKGLMNLIKGDTKEFVKYGEADCDKIDIYNMYYFIYLLHEIAHIRQRHFAYDTKYSSFEKRLFKFHWQLSEETVFDNYDVNVAEINARNVSRVSAFNIYNKLPDDVITKNDKHMLQMVMAYSFYTDNYEVLYNKDAVISPMEKLIEKIDDFELLHTTINRKDNFYDFIDKNDFSIYKKIMFGLPISLIEYAYTNLMYDGLINNPDMNFFKRLQKKLY